MTPCLECGKPCTGKALTCSAECRAIRTRAAQARLRDRKRGGPRTCVVCGKLITAKSATTTCSHDCWRANRLGKSLEELPKYIPRPESAQCYVCGVVFVPKNSLQKGCSEECMRKGRLARKLASKRKGPFPERACLVCGKTFKPIRDNHVACRDRECRLEFKRRLAAKRNSGVLKPGTTQIFCVVCGRECWALAGTLLCESRECLLERNRQTSRKRRGIEPCCCIVCGERFWPPPGRPGSHYTCSPGCSRTALLRKNRRTYEAHRERRLAEQAYRLATDPEYRDRRRAADAAYRQRQAEMELLRLATEIERKLDDHEREPGTGSDGRIASDDDNGTRENPNS